MTRRPARPSPPPPKSANLTAANAMGAIPQLERRIAELEAFDPNTINAGDDPPIRALEARIEQTLARIFGPDTHEYKKLSLAFHLDLSNYLALFDGSSPPPNIKAGVRNGLDRAITLLREAVVSLKEQLRYAVADPALHGSEAREPTRSAAANDVFLVHGHDSAAKVEVARILERAGVKVTILHEQPNAGRTIIEKFENYAGAAGFAVVLLTPDDEGGPVGGPMNPRARQNVVGEMFWFAGKLGRKSVCALRKRTLRSRPISQDWVIRRWTTEGHGKWSF